MVARWRWFDEATSCGSASNLRQASRSARWREFGTTLTAVRSACLAGDQQPTLGSSGFRSPEPGNLANGLRNHPKFETDIRSELPTPSRKRDGVLVYGSASRDATRPGRGKSRSGGAFGAWRSARRALGLEAESRGPTPTPTVALAPPAATLSDSRALWLTGGLSLTGGLLLGAFRTNVTALPMLLVIA